MSYLSATLPTGTAAQESFKVIVQNVCDDRYNIGQHLNEGIISIKSI